MKYMFFIYYAEVGRFSFFLVALVEWSGGGDIL